MKRLQMREKFMIEILPVLEKHIQAIALLEKDIFSDPWGEKAIKDYLLSPSARGFVLLEDGKIRSYALFLTLLDEGELLRIGTEKSCLRRGFALMLLKHYFAQSKTEGVEKIFLEVRKENLAARHLYEKTGFCLIGTRKGYYKNPADDACIYQKIQNGTGTL